MKIKKSQLEKLVKEAVQSQLGLQQEEMLPEATAKMTRQHFQLIADVLRETHAPDEVKVAFAKALAQTNPGFKEALFLKAAGGLTSQGLE